ncbi:MAG: O-acetyl-ADP-ribose deacetylase [Pyrinomonadaceae bacterium]
MKIEVIKGDITEIEVDAIVNAANSSLLGGGGVDGAIHRKGGSVILNECIAIRNSQGGCDVGEAVITGSGKLPSKHVIHTVGPVWNGGKSDEETKLRNCYINSMNLAASCNLTSIAFPNISTGIYKFPKDLACEIGFDAVSYYETDIIRRLLFVCFDEENYKLYRAKIAG